MPACFLVSDLHGRVERYRSLLAAITAEHPAAVFLAGDLLPSGFGLGASADATQLDFIRDFLCPAFERARASMGPEYPDVFAILGNDDPRSEEAAMLGVAGCGLWRYAHGQRIGWRGYTVLGYACVPPTPFRLKDWERYDVSRFVDPGCCSPEEGWRTVPADASEIRYGTIAKDLDILAGDAPLDRAIMLFHCPPYRSELDRAALDGQSIDAVPLDVHVGSIAIRRFIERRQPRVTLHGHVHESARLTGRWAVQIGSTCALSGAHDGPELALVRFDPDAPWLATRTLT
jgi:uncharacterized protein